MAAAAALLAAALGAAAVLRLAPRAPAGRRSVAVLGYLVSLAMDELEHFLIPWRL